MNLREYREERAKEIWIDERQFTVHIEPSEQGSGECAYCTRSGQEISTSIGVEQLPHSSNCPAATATDRRTDQ